MTPTETTCERCERPARDNAHVCDHCIGEFERTLGDIPAAVEEVEITLTRQKGAATNGTSSSATKPLPWHDKAAEALRHLHATLVKWVRFYDAEQVRGRPDWFPREHPESREKTLRECSLWLIHVRNGVAFHDSATEAIDELTDAVAECWRIVFWKKRSRSYLGKCEQAVTDDDGTIILLSCQGEVYAEEGEDAGICEDCEQPVNVLVRKAEIDQRLDDHLCTAAEAAGFATYLDLGVDRDRMRKRINQWHSRERLLPARTEQHDDGSETTWFRWREIRELLVAEYRRDSA